jgi:hypothetical protein
MAEPIPIRREQPQDREQILEAMVEMLEKLDRLELFQAGAHLSLAIESLSRGRAGTPAGH